MREAFLYFFAFLGFISISFMFIFMFIHIFLNLGFYVLNGMGSSFHYSDPLGNVKVSRFGRGSSVPDRVVTGGWGGYSKFLGSGMLLFIVLV